jgi:hypothetical protein
MQSIVDTIRSHVFSHRDAIISFLRVIVAILSYDGNIRGVAMFLQIAVK